MWGKWSPTRDTAVDLGIYQPLYERRLQEYRNERERWRRRGERPPAPAGKEEEAAPYSLHKLAGACGSSFLMGVLCATPYYGCQTAFRAAKGHRLRSAWAAVQTEAPRMGGLVATFNLALTSSMWGVSYLRGTKPEEETNYLVGAFMAGALLSARRGVWASVSSGAWVCLFVYLIHYARGKQPAVDGAGTPDGQLPIGQ